MEGEQRRRVKRKESDMCVSLRSFRTPLLCQTESCGKSELKFAKNGFNSSDEDESLRKPEKIKGILINTEGEEARGAPYLATN